MLRPPMSLEHENRPNWNAAIVTVIWAIATGLIARLLLVFVLQHWGGRGALHWAESSPVGLALGAIVIQLALLVLVVLRASHLPALGLTLIGALRREPSRWLPSLMLILGIGPLANGFGLAVAKVTGSGVDSMEFVGGLIRRATLPELTLLGVVLTVFPAIVEESLFRGLFMGSLRGVKVPWLIALQALAFGVFHLDVAQGAATFVLGIGFGYIAFATGSLLGGMVAHAGYNLMVLLSQRFLAGGAEASLAAQLLELTVGSVLAAVSAKQLYFHARERAGASTC